MYEHTLRSIDVAAVAVARLAAAQSPSGRSTMEGESCLPANGETDCRQSLRLTVCVFINPFGRADGVLIGVEPIGQ